MAEINRRRFIQKAGGAAAAVAGASLIGTKGWAGANDRIRVGLIGLNGRGGSHLNGFSNLKNVEVAALCDPDKGVIARRQRELEKKTGRKAKTFSDLRELFDDKEIDAVGIATPNHWHSLATIWACQAGKDVYCEKPGSHNVFEGAQVVKAAKKYERIVQIGAQSRSSEALQEAVQKLRDGAIGEVYMAKGLCYKWRNTIGSVGKPAAPPPNVDYNLWLGPAPQRDTVPRRRLHYDWHWQFEYGSGDIGNQGIHEMDKARWGLGVDFPTEVTAMGGHYMFEDDQNTPNTLLTAFRYPEQNKMLVFEVRHWISNHEGGIGSGDSNTVGNIFYGSEGYMVMPSYHSYQIFMGRKREAQPVVSKGGDHFANFIDAVRSRDASKLNAPVKDVRISAALCHLANVSYKLGHSFKFNPKTEKIEGAGRKANRLLTRKYRAPFEVTEKV